MTSLQLQCQVADERAGTVLRDVVQAFESGFPGRIAGYYLHGTVADGTSIQTSDLDIDIVVRDAFAGPDERRALQDLAGEIAKHSAVELDIDVTDQTTLGQGAEPSFKVASRLLFGQDIRPDVPLTPIDGWGREKMHRGYFLLMSVFERQPPACIPLPFPDPRDEFFGYLNRPVRDGSAEFSPGTRNLVRVSGWLATALLAHEAGQYVATKRECHRLYRDYFDDDWASLLEEMYASCRGDWEYRIPSDREARRRLRSICRRTLAFENHFLLRYKPFIIQELSQAQPGEPSRATWLMERIPFEDVEIARVL